MNIRQVDVSENLTQLEQRFSRGRQKKFPKIKKFQQTLASLGAALSKLSFIADVTGHCRFLCKIADLNFSANS